MGKRIGSPVDRARKIDRAWASVQERVDALLDRSQELVDLGRKIRKGKWNPFSIQPVSCNRKLAPQRVEIANSGRERFVATGPYVASSYVSISATCPSSCPFKDNGCYAQAGQTHLIMGRLDRAGRALSPLTVTRAEAAAIGALWPRGVPQDGAAGGRDFRLHVGGDTSCTRGTRALADAVETLHGRGLGDAWSYTHRWRTIPREAWGSIRVLASVETSREIVEAKRRGYAPALTVDVARSEQPYQIGGVRMIPCPYESTPKQPTCSQCRLCLRDLSDTNEGIVFSVHGNDAKLARRSLRVIQGKAA